MNLNDLVDRMDRIEAKLDHIDKSVVELGVKWNGGPGGWPVCSQNIGTLLDHEKRLRWSERKINMALGAMALVSIGLAVYSAIR